MPEADQYLQEFIEEAKSHIDNVEQAFLDTEHFRQNETLIHDVFRAIHSIKGTAGFFQLPQIVSLSHAMENVLGQMRTGTVSLTDDALDVLLSCTDVLKSMIYDAENSNHVDITHYLSGLDGILNPKDGQPLDGVPQTTEGQTDQASPPPLPVKEKFRPILEKQAKKGHQVYRLSIPFNLDFPLYGQAPYKLFSELQDVGEIIDATCDGEEAESLEHIAKALEALEKDQTVTLELLVTSILEPALFSESVQLPLAYVEPLDMTKVNQAPAKAVPPVADIQPATAQPVATQPAPASEKPEANTHHIKPEETIRVHVKLLENLMALSGEMVLARNQLLTAFKNKNTESDTMGKILQNIDILTSRLQEEIMLTRMQPIGNIFNKFPRVIHEISKNLGKDIALNIEGKEIELDKTMIESLSDPIIHLVRNCADHGLEPPHQREQAGKPLKGTITLRAYHKRGLVAIEVSDDGSGINVAAVKQKALEKGLITQQEADTLTDAEVSRLIFLPGFSTAQAVSDISGRGVGMDVVSRNVEKLGGTVDIHSVPGAGTAITMFLPRTLAIMQSLIVGVLNHRFALPQTGVVQVVNLTKSSGVSRLERIQNAWTLRLRGQLIPVIPLKDVLELPGETSPTGKGKVVIINVLKRQVGLWVDEVFDTEETLVKPLPASLKGCMAYAGVTIMGDGKISLILDPEGLAKKYGISMAEEEKKVAEDKAHTAQDQEETQEAQSMIMFCCSGPEHYAVDINMVARVETILASDIEHIGEKMYVTIRGKTIQVIRPEDHLPVQRNEYTQHKLTVIIPNMVKRPVGMLVEKIIDSVKARFDLESNQLNTTGIFGSILYNNRIVLVLNMFELFETAGAEASKEAKASAALNLRVLLAEDTPFFLKIEAKYLQDAGCTVTTAENGKEALNILKQQPRGFDLIVSDLMMPEMGGLDFIKQARQIPDCAHLPAIALTSMKADAYEVQAAESGFNAFENKLHKDHLLETIHKLLNKQKGVSTP